MLRRSHLLVLTMILAQVGSGTAQPVKVDEPAVCLECHADLDLANMPRHVHTAFETGQCSQCHNPHASKHATLLAADQKELCLTCHADVADEITLTAAHQPAGNGQCVLCHDPHAADHANQLHQAVPDLCHECHAQAAAWSQKTTIHTPVADGDCQTCHAAHGSDNDGLLTGSVPALCQDCHTQDRAFTAAHGGHAVGDSDCTACHDPHAADLKGLVYANQHSPFSSGNCATCHGNLDQTGSFAIATGVQELCLRCHRGVQEFETKTYRHNLDQEDSCGLCHNPHASPTNSLLAADSTILCMRCHFNEPGPKAKSDFLTHDGMDCLECHLPHGAENPTYLKSIEVDLCAGCHEAAHRASHPVGPEVIDARSGEAVTCLSCHQLHGADFEYYLPLSPEMDLCIQCHKR